MEHRLFQSGEVPYFCKLDFFQKAWHVPPGHQVGHAERTTMVANAVRRFIKDHKIDSISDLGCGDGALLRDLANLKIKVWGYEAGAENIEVAQKARLDVRYADIVNDKLEYGDLSVCCEVLEHLYDPRAFLRNIESKYVILSSPSAETDKWHYLEHSWAWDLQGYRQLAEDCGFRVLGQETVTAHGVCDYLGNGDKKHPEFQCLVVEKE